MSTETKIANTLGIIPARGGSKGLPRKNVRLLGDLPLIAHTIRAACESRMERVMVSTDDEEIAQVAAEWGAEVPFRRPPEYSHDSATSLSVLLHALHFMEKEKQVFPAHVIYLQPTSPFRNAAHINEALDLHLRSETESLIAVTEVQEFHPYFMFEIQGNSRLKPLVELDHRPLRRQDLPVYYRINGALYITRRSYYDHLPADAAIFNWNSVSAYVMDAPSSIDINDYLDFQRAELYLQKRNETP